MHIIKKIQINYKKNTFANFFNRFVKNKLFRIIIVILFTSKLMNYYKD